jgi:hypothetical protein
MEQQIKIFQLLFQTWATYLGMTNEDVLNRFRTFRVVKLQPVRSYRYERRLISQNEHLFKKKRKKKEETGELSIFGNFGRG